ncbi:MAG: hypothetical protein AB8B63_05990 [Granulosicoccus sp.]
MSESGFNQMTVACMRTLASHPHSLSRIDATALQADCELQLPDLHDENDPDMRRLLRGLGDSLAMMQIYHDPQIHQLMAPENPVADRLFTLLERERFEESGARVFPGVAINLQHVWALGHDVRILSRSAGNEQLELVLACLCRESLSSRRLPSSIQRYLEPLREPLDTLVGNHIQTLGRLTHNQTDYARCSLDLIAELGFDIKPREAEQAVLTELEDEALDAEDGELTPQQQPDDNSTASEENEDDTQSDPIDHAKLVRNADTSDDSEPELLDDELPTVESLGHTTDHAAAEDRFRYRVFDKSLDEVCAASDLPNAGKSSDLREQLDERIAHIIPLVRSLARQLQQILLTRQYTLWQHDLDEGELNTQRLTRIITAADSTCAYRSRVEDAVADCTVTLLIDNSRSMLGEPIVTAAAGADIITRVLERCGASSEVLGYTTSSMYGGNLAERWLASGSPPYAGRLNSIRHIVYKSVDASWRRSRDNFGLMLDKDLLKQNIDGEALLWACKRLCNRHESRRILMVLSDGRPSDSYTQRANDSQYLSNHLTHVVRQIEKQNVVEVVAIGLGHDVSQHYRHCVQVDDLEQLATTMFSELGCLLSGAP